MLDLTDENLFLLGKRRTARPYTYEGIKEELDIISTATQAYRFDLEYFKEESKALTDFCNELLNEERRADKKKKRPNFKDGLDLESDVDDYYDGAD